MAITRSYNRKTDTYYAYETTYVWSEEKQKKVQKRRCIGKIDPKTDKIMPTGKRGRPRAKNTNITADNSQDDREISMLNQQNYRHFMKITAANITEIQTLLGEIAQEMGKLSKD
ncbi:MAG: hypothetical protein IJ083_16210 [Clostridia bacterium]|nr:hypothetical protein [Clostridia bacterium]